MDHKKELLWSLWVNPKPLRNLESRACSFDVWIKRNLPFLRTRGSGFEVFKWCRGLKAMAILGFEELEVATLV